MGCGRISVLSQIIFAGAKTKLGNCDCPAGVLCIVPSQRISPAEFLRVSSMRAVNRASVCIPLAIICRWGFWPSSRNVRPFCVYVPLTRPVGPNRNRNVASEDPTLTRIRGSPRRLRWVQRSGPPEQSLSAPVVVASLESILQSGQVSGRGCGRGRRHRDWCCSHRRGHGRRYRDWR